MNACYVFPQLRNTINALDGINGGSPGEVSEKNKKESNDQRALVTRYYLIKEFAFYAGVNLGHKVRVIIMDSPVRPEFR